MPTIQIPTQRKNSSQNSKSKKIIINSFILQTKIASTENTNQSLQIADLN